MTNDMGTPVVRPLMQSGCSDDGQPGYSYNRPRFDSIQDHFVEPLVRPSSQADRPPEYNYNRSPVGNRGTPAVESFACM